MGTLVRAVITGFGFSLGKMMFDKLRERYVSKNQPERVIVVNAKEFRNEAGDRDR